MDPESADQAPMQKYGDKDHGRLRDHLDRHVEPALQAELLRILTSLLGRWHAPLVMIDYRRPVAKTVVRSVRLVPCRSGVARMVRVAGETRAYARPAGTPSRAIALSPHLMKHGTVLAARLMHSLSLAWPDYARPARLTAYSDGQTIAFCPEEPAVEWPWRGVRSGAPHIGVGSEFIDIISLGSPSTSLAESLKAVACFNTPSVQ